MEALLNELSFHNQFNSFEQFQNGALKEIINFFHLQKSGKITVYKKSSIYSRKIYNDKSLHEILISKDREGKSDEIRKLKTQLASIINDPFWDNAKLCSVESEYLYSDNNVNDSCLAEGFERECSIISINPSNFLSEELSIYKNGILKVLPNYFSRNILVQKLYNDGIIEFEFFCKTFFGNTKLNFSLSSSGESFKNILKKSDEDEFFNSFEMFAEMSWNDILQQGGKGENKAGLAYSRYSNQSYFAKYNPKTPIYKFRTSQKYRVFGFRDEEIFYVLEFDLTHKLSD